MTDLTSFPIPTEVLDPANYPEFVGATGAAGADGQEIELQKTATHVQWRYVGGTWADLVALTDITGPVGAAGDDGAAGVGVPAGGTSSQLLAKNSNTNYDTHWIDAPIAQNAIEGAGVAKITSNTTEPTAPTVGDLWIDEASSPTMTFSKTRLFESASTHTYSGSAPSGSAQSSAVWSIVRQTFSADGVLTATGAATAVAWTNRASATYV